MTQHWKQTLSRRSMLKLLGRSLTLLVPLRLKAEQQAPLKRPSDNTKPERLIVAIMHNQLGYKPEHKKVAIVVLNRSHPNPQTSSPSFHVWTSDRKRKVFSGQLSRVQDDALSGDAVCAADFSPLTKPGKYILEADGTFSDIFPVANDVYAAALRSTIRAYYGQRCGCEVDLGGGYKHAICHQDGSFSPTSGKSGKLPNQGGWHDAGDYGRYIVNSGITCGTLLWAWELLPEPLQALSLDIPESGKAIPDVLAEIQWNLRWMLSMQDPADGGVWHKQTSRAFCAFVMPEDDKLPSEVIGTGSPPYKSTCATADFAATMAIAARCYKKSDPAFAAQCLNAARRAYAWSLLHPNVPFRNPPGITTGEYGDSQCFDELLWSAAELFRTTGEPSFETDFLARFASLPSGFRLRAPSWGDVAALGLWAYALTPKAASNPSAQQIRDKTKEAGAILIAQAKHNGYGHTMAAHDYIWGSNSVAGNQALLLIVSNILESNQAATEAAMANLHYLLGRNCFGVSWVTQLGVRPFQHPHHRPSAADSVAAPWPGLLAAGPNISGGDPITDALPRAAPMRAWVDDQKAYAVNEVAINWNAPLVFLLAAANHHHNPA